MNIYKYTINIHKYAINIYKYAINNATRATTQPACARPAGEEFDDVISAGDDVVEAGDDDVVEPGDDDEADVVVLGTEGHSVGQFIGLGRTCTRSMYSLPWSLFEAPCT